MLSSSSVIFGYLFFIFSYSYSLLRQGTGNGERGTGIFVIYLGLAEKLRLDNLSA
jgi:hypothetical protein